MTPPASPRKIPPRPPDQRRQVTRGLAEAPAPTPGPDPSAAGPALVWFRRDLRLADNAALQAAMDHHPVVIPVYVHAPGDEAPWAPGAASRRWLHHSLTALTRQLQRKGAPMVVRRAATARAGLDALVRETGARAIYWNTLYEPTAQARDDALEAHFQAQGLVTGRFPGALLVEPWELRPASGTHYQKHAPYWRALRLRLEADPGLLATRPELRRLAGSPEAWPSLSVDELALVPPNTAGPPFPEHGAPGERGAHARWRAFTDEALADYRQGRHRPGSAGASRMAPRLHFGEVTPRQLWSDVQRRMAGQPADFPAPDTQALLAELGWREFAHHLLWHRPELPDRVANPRFATLAWRDPTRDALAAADLARWQAGLTGYPFLDAGLRQLRRTGFLPSRLRMATAMALVKNLLIDWRAGERWFWETLADAGLAGNSFNWQWIAGCGPDAHPYFRVFNPVTQGERFDADGGYVRRWVPEVAGLPPRYLHAPWLAPGEVLDAAGIAPGSPYRRPLFEVAQSRAMALGAYREALARAPAKPCSEETS